MPVTQTGMREARAAVQRLPGQLEAALRKVAHKTATRVLLDARRLLNQQTAGTGRTAEAIRIEEDISEKQFLVRSRAPQGKPANLPAWLEYGTAKMTARPYMRPATQAAESQYVSEMREAAERTASEVLR